MHQLLNVVDAFIWDLYIVAYLTMTQDIEKIH